jgi:hypothetical protein
LNHQGRNWDKKDKSVNNLNDRLDNYDNDRDYDNLSKWNGKWIIPAEEWMQGTNVYGALQCFPDKFLPEILQLDRFIMCFRLKSTFDTKDPALREAFQSWKRDYLALLEFRKDPDYGHMKCNRCLLEPGWDNGLNMGIFRVLANSLELEDSPYRSIYTCNIVNRFRYPYDRTIERDSFVTKYNIARKNSTEVDYLFHLGKIADAADTALHQAQNLGKYSVIDVNSPRDVYNILTDMGKLESILDQGLEEDGKFCYLDEGLREREKEENKWKEDDKEKYKSTIIDFFTSIKDRININDLTVYPRPSYPRPNYPSYPQ